MAKEPVITFSELMKEVSKYVRVPNNKKYITSQQYKFLKAALEKKMTWPDIMKLWKKAGWPSAHYTSLSRMVKNKVIKD